MQWAGGTAWGWAALGKAGGSRVGGDLCGDPNTSLMCLLQSLIFSGFALLSSSGPHVSPPPTSAKAAGRQSWELHLWAGWELSPDLSLCFALGSCAPSRPGFPAPQHGAFAVGPAASPGAGSRKQLQKCTGFGPIARVWAGLAKQMERRGLEVLHSRQG